MSRPVGHDIKFVSERPIDGQRSGWDAVERVRMIVVGEIGLCRWACGQGAIGVGDVDAFVAHIRGMRPRPGLVLMDFVHDVSMPSACERRRIAEAVRDILAPSHGVAGHVVTSNSGLGRGVMAAVSWVTTTPFPEAAVPNPQAALQWAKQRSPGLDVGAVVAELRLRVPGFERLIW